MGDLSPKCPPPPPPPPPLTAFADERALERKMNKKKDSFSIPEYIVDPTTKTTYLKGKFIGKGGFARVHELTDLTTNKLYAGKIVPKYSLLKSYQKEKMLREIELHRSLQHPNIVRFHHFFGDSHNIYIILENCSRKSLVHVLKHRKSLTEPEVRYYLRQLCDGVQYIHSRHVIHRDLKLGNMLLTESMRLKIADFGLATRLLPSPSHTASTKKPTVCGTPNYIAPEVLNRKAHGFEMDIWAVGCIMYAMLVGLPPFESSSLSETYNRITRNCYYIPGHVSDPAQDLIRQILQGCPKDRPSIPEILRHGFFTGGYCPETLPTSACYTVPKFPVTPPAVSPATQSSLVTRSSKLENGSTPPPPPSLDPQQLLSPGLASLGLHHTPTTKEEIKKETKKDIPFHCNLKQKFSSILCIDKSKKAKNSFAKHLHQKVLYCIENMPKDSCSNPPAYHNVAPLCVTKWIDYSNKYGFGFQLSDRSIGILFNDSTKMCLSPDRARIEFYDTSGKFSSYPAHSMPSSLEEKANLLHYFTQYMDENLTEGGNIHQEGAAKRKGTLPYMKLWLRITQAIIMLLSTGTLQVNFFKDHTKMIASSENKRDVSITYINEEKQVCTYSIEDLTLHGCTDKILNRLKYILWVLQEFTILDSDD